jgi:hypothetical protein
MTTAAAAAAAAVATAAACSGGGDGGGGGVQRGVVTAAWCRDSACEYVGATARTLVLVFASHTCKCLTDVASYLLVLCSHVDRC